MQESKFDCCVIGGGMIGAALALGLAKQSYTVALIEKDALEPFDSAQGPDIRVSALNMHSISLLKSLGAWQYVQEMRSRPYNTLRVWDGEDVLAKSNEKTNVTQFTAAEIGHDVLGYFVENRILQLALYAQINASWQHKITCLHALEITSIDVEAGRVALSNKQQIKASILLGADGANSQLRRAAGIPTSGWQYTQKANAILIETNQKVSDETWQVFQTSGPRALLPMHDNYACLIWYHDPQNSKWIQEASKKELKQAIVADFPELIGDFDIVNVAGFPLTRMHARRYGFGKAIIAGDAAHTINPLAGQGVNLGFQDVEALLNIIQNKGLDDPQSIITQYEKKRRVPNLFMMSLMDVIYKSFSSSVLPVKMARSVGLALANKAGPIKKQALKYAMGLAS